MYAILAQQAFRETDLPGVLLVSWADLTLLANWTNLGILHSVGTTIKIEKINKLICWVNLFIPIDQSNYFIDRKKFLKIKDEAYTYFFPQPSYQVDP